MQDIDPVKKTLVACFPDDVGMDEACFQLEYDILVLGGFLPAYIPKEDECSGCELGRRCGRSSRCSAASQRA